MDTSADKYFKSKMCVDETSERTGEGLMNVYDDWADTYEQDIEGKLGCEAGDKVADKLCELYPSGPRQSIRILDVGAGTGLVGRQLKDHGFVYIDALDPSSTMLDKARKRNLYQRYFCEYITSDPLDIEKGWYDVVTGVGMLGANHAPFSAIREMIRVTKSGGHILLALRNSLLQRHDYRDLEPMMKDLETEGQWQKVSHTVFPNYFKDAHGILYVYQVL